MKKKIDSRLLIFVAIFWTAAAISSFPHVTIAEGATTANPVVGKQLFEKRCTGCHSLDTNKEGPRLRGVYGRKAGTVPDFTYSNELKASKIVWDEQSLDRWLVNPDVMVANSDMAFHVSNPQERADIIQFLRQSPGK